MSKHKAQVIDLFCGIGGMTHGFVLEEFNVLAGIDIDESCRYGYEKNNNAQFINKDINEVSSSELESLYEKDSIKVLIGCAPCQPFSTLNVKRDKYINSERIEKWGPLRKFAHLVEEIKPEIVSMENVKDLANPEKYPIFQDFLKTLERNNYFISYKVVDCSRYGIPQRRKRLVLLASRLGPIQMIPETHTNQNFKTVREAIGHLSPVEDGEVPKTDYLHRTRKLNEINKRRIIATPHDGGSAKDWDESLVLDCHKKASGSTYKCSVYGRMKWDEPATTMTTQCIGLGNGRFGHPEQDRAITLREAAIFQTFPEYYQFVQDPSNARVNKLALHIGNAVPVELGKVIAKSISVHLESN